MAKKSIAWQTGTGNITLTYQGQGDGIISVQSDANKIGSARSQVITIKTTEGSPVIAKNLTIRQAACPFPVGDVRNYAYSGSYQEVELPAGQYKLQCWGAQGGSNAAYSSYNITAKAGGKGGYSEGILTLSQKTTVRVYVGGQGSSSAGGFNGGGSTVGSSSYSQGTSGQPGYHFGISRMGGGGGATDIRLSYGALLSRMIVAGGGSGGAMCYEEVTTVNESYTDAVNWFRGYRDSASSSVDDYVSDAYYVSPGSNYRLYCNALGTKADTYMFFNSNGQALGSSVTIPRNTYVTITPPANTSYVSIIATVYKGYTDFTFSTTCELITYDYITNTYNESQEGFVGGGTTGGGYSSGYKGKQNAAGTGGSFGQGANQTASNYRYCSGAGGGGWYGGGGGQYNDNDMGYCKYSGGGSGWVNTYANRGNRPSGYTGLQLDSGSTTAGSSSFPAPSGGNETGHAGNGYARITRLS